MTMVLCFSTLLRGQGRCYLQLCLVLSKFRIRRAHWQPLGDNKEKEVSPEVLIAYLSSFLGVYRDYYLQLLGTTLR